MHRSTARAERLFCRESDQPTTFAVHYAHCYFCTTSKMFLEIRKWFKGTMWSKLLYLFHLKIFPREVPRLSGHRPLTKIYIPYSLLTPPLEKYPASTHAVKKLSNNHFELGVHFLDICFTHSTNYKTFHWMLPYLNGNHNSLTEKYSLEYNVL